MKLPANINSEVTFLLQETNKLHDNRINGWLKQQINNGWNICAVNQNRGRCYSHDKIITIPLFAVKRGIDYNTWYMSHELAHSFAEFEMPDTNHGPLFMNWLKRICPVEFQHYEYNYKPRNAFNAGVAISREMLF